MRLGQSHVRLCMGRVRLWEGANHVMRLGQSHVGLFYKEWRYGETGYGI
jgi:hypothetical protein